MDNDGGGCGGGDASPSSATDHDAFVGGAPAHDGHPYGVAGTGLAGGSFGHFRGAAGERAASTASPAIASESLATDPNCDTSLGSYCGSCAFADCLLELSDGTELPAHRIVLATRSAVFRAILAGDFEESRSCRLQVEADAAVARVLLRYIYTGRAMVCNDVALGLYLLADKYGFAELRAACFRHMFQHLTGDNVCEVFRATQHPDLADACARFFGKQDIEGMAVRRSFQDLSGPELQRLLAALRRVYDPCAEYLFRVMWRCAGMREARMRDPLWDDLLSNLDVAQLSPPTVIGKIKMVVPQQRYLQLLEAIVRRNAGPDIGPLDEEGFPASQLLRYASVHECPVPVIEAAVVRLLKSRFGDSLPFSDIIEHLGHLLDPTLFVVRPEDVHAALAGLVARRYIDTDGGGWYQYRA